MKARLERWPRQLLMLPVRAYRLFFSAWLGSSCRFIPSCSAYALEALERHGALAGSYLTAHRLLRCHPGCTGGHDPVPACARPRATPSTDSSSEAGTGPRPSTEISP